MKSTHRLLVVTVLIILAMVSVACTTGQTDPTLEPTLDMTTDSEPNDVGDEDMTSDPSESDDTIGSAEITGTVNAEDASALTEGSTVTVQLVDVTAADAPAEVLAESVIQDVSSFPVDWSLTYDESLIEEGDIVAVQAVVTDGDNNLLYTNTSQYRVLTDGNPADNVEITVDAIE